MTTYNWNCKTVDCYPEQDNEADVVYNVHWIVTGTSDDLRSRRKCLLSYKHWNTISRHKSDNKLYTV